VKYSSVKNSLDPQSAIGPLALVIRGETLCKGIAFSRQSIAWRGGKFRWISLTGGCYFVNLLWLGLLWFGDVGTVEI